MKEIVKFNKVIGNIGEDTYVAVNYAHSWTICIYERYHNFSEININEFINLLKKAKKDLLKAKKQN